MKRGLTGRYEVSHIGGEEVRAFIPHLFRILNEGTVLQEEK